MAFLEKLARLNRTAVFLVTFALLLVGLIVGGVIGGLVLLVLAVLLAALTATTWPAQPSSTRVLRATVLILLVITAVITMVRG
ncbi:MAG TPA: DUF6703 family protein [Candidatus Limnocylindrales bacterium]|nr:DUF6703 family protein [Candidatus Limnocylindrales bacterium]